MTSGLVSVIVLNRDQRDLLADCLTSVERQTYGERETIVIDNGSTDGSRELLLRGFRHWRLVLHESNLGFSAGHNAGIREAAGAYLLLLNADLVLEPTFLEEMVRVMEQHPTVGMVQGKLYQMAARERYVDERRFDSLGLCLTRDRRVVLRGHGEIDRGQYDAPQEIFAPDGAAPLYRRQMLEDIRLDGQYLDEQFFMYREEVDLGWRARWRGWQAWYAPRAVAYHVRRYGPGGRRRQPRWLRRLQLRNRYCLLLKNEAWTTALADLLHIAWFEVRALGYSLVAEQHYLLAYLDAVRLAPVMWRRRWWIMRHRTVGAKELAVWLRGCFPG